MSIEVSNLSFSYAKTPVLSKLNFRVQNGEFISVLGANGAGKSTLFRCMLGLLKYHTGTICVQGQDIRRLSIREAARRIAYIPQSHYPSFNYSVFDMTLMGTSVHSPFGFFPGARQKEQARQALEKIGITHLQDRGYTSISGGERQLTLIARALAQQSPILIFDEPTANLDYGNQIRILTKIRSLTKEGRIVIQATHNPEQAFLFSHRIIAIKNGIIIADGKTQDVLTARLISELYGLDVEIQSAYKDRMRLCVPVGISDNL